MLVYLFGYVITQFLLFFERANVVVSFLGLNWGLKQAQWTSLVVFILLLPLTFLIFRFSKPVPVGEVAATYGIPQKPEAETKIVKEDEEEEQTEVDEKLAIEEAEPREVRQAEESEETEEKIEKT